MVEKVILVVLIAAFVSYLLSFPLFGPLSESIPEKLADMYYTVFLASHFVGIAIAGLIIDGVERRVLVLKILAAFLIAAVFLFYTGYYIIASAIQGASMGMLMVVWGTILSRVIKPWERAKILAIAAAIANVFLLFIQYSGNKNVFLAAIPLIPVFLLPEIKIDAGHSWRINRDIINFALPVAIFYILGGFMYAAMEPKFREAGISVHVLFYVIVILIAGYLYDKFGRKVVSIAGLLLLALSYVLFSRIMLLSSYLIQSSYGFIDVFSMIIWADLSHYGSEGKHYGIGVFTIVASLLAGYKIILWYGLNPFDFESIALTLLLLASISIAVVKEPMLSEEEYAVRAANLGGVFR